MILAKPEPNPGTSADPSRNGQGRREIDRRLTRLNRSRRKGLHAAPLSRGPNPTNLFPLTLPVSGRVGTCAGVRFRSGAAAVGRIDRGPAKSKGCGCRCPKQKGQPRSVHLHVPDLEGTRQSLVEAVPRLPNGFPRDRNQVRLPGLPLSTQRESRFPIDSLHQEARGRHEADVQQLFLAQSLPELLVLPLLPRFLRVRRLHPAVSNKFGLHGHAAP